MANEFNEHSTDAVLSQVKTVLERVEKRLDVGDAIFKEQEQRIRRLENWRFYVVGLGAGLALVLRAVWEWIVGGMNPPKH